MLERTQIFVDTSYLLASFYNSWEIGARAQLEIDLPEVVATLGQMVQQQLGQQVHRQLWYDGIPDTGPHRYQRALRTCDGVQLRAGQLIEWGERRTQKAVDTRLVADMVLSGVRREFTDIVLVSGDADMIPGVQEAVNAGVRVHLYGFGWDSMSSALRHACDSTTILDPREDFSDCMQLEVLEGPLPPVVRGQAECNQDTEGDHGEECPHDADTEPRPGTTEYNPQSPAAHSSEQSDVPDAEAVHQDLGADRLKAHHQQMASMTGDQDRSAEDHVTEDHTKEPEQVVLEPEVLDAESEAEPHPTPATMAHAHHKPAETNREEVRKPGHRTIRVTSRIEESVELTVSDDDNEDAQQPQSAPTPASMKPRATPAPNPSMMAPRRKLRSRYVPLPNEVWASAGYQTPFDVGQQYAVWWYDNAATPEQRDSAHLLSGGGLPPEIDRPLLQFACETLHEYTLTESQRVNLRDGFHSGIRSLLINNQKKQ